MYNVECSDGHHVVRAEDLDKFLLDKVKKRVVVLFIKLM